jgi:hypothetical protein
MSNPSRKHPGWAFPEGYAVIEQTKLEGKLEVSIEV